MSTAPTYETGTKTYEERKNEFETVYEKPYGGIDRIKAFVANYQFNRGVPQSLFPALETSSVRDYSRAILRLEFPTKHARIDIDFSYETHKAELLDLAKTPEGCQTIENLWKKCYPFYVATSVDPMFYIPDILRNQFPRESRRIRDEFPRA